MTHYSRKIIALAGKKGHKTAKDERQRGGNDENGAMGGSTGRIESAGAAILSASGSDSEPIASPTLGNSATATPEAAPMPCPPQVNEITASFTRGIDRAMEGRTTPMDALATMEREMGVAGWRRP